MRDTLHYIVKKDTLHAQWLNTLSFMENAGARKISACEHATDVGIIQLKHAAEEHRHAYYLKKQITKIDATQCLTYSDAELLAPKATRYYLHALDMQTCRYLKKQFQLTGNALKYAAYLYVTYAIEVRADVLYPIYQEVLTAARHRVMVKSIIAEEEGHLEEMLTQLKAFRSDWQKHATVILHFETLLFEEWINSIEKELHYV